MCSIFLNRMYRVVFWLSPRVLLSFNRVRLSLTSISLRKESRSTRWTCRQRRRYIWDTGARAPPSSFKLFLKIKIVLPCIDERSSTIIFYFSMVWFHDLVFHQWAMINLKLSVYYKHEQLSHDKETENPLRKLRPLPPLNWNPGHVTACWTFRRMNIQVVHRTLTPRFQKSSEVWISRTFRIDAELRAWHSSSKSLILCCEDFWQAFVFLTQIGDSGPISAAVLN
jgi:hypothetical protein